MTRELAPISVVISVYNDHQYLSSALQSVLAQTLLPRQIIVVDDGSDEDIAGTIINDFKYHALGVKIDFFRKENAGASSARNWGLSYATEEYIAFLDVDDTMLSNNLLEKFNMHEQLDESYFGVYGGAIRSTGEEETFADVDGIISVELLDVYHQGIPGGAPFFLFNKKALIEINGFDETLTSNEDFDLLIRLMMNNKKCKGSTSAGFFRNIRDNSLSRPNNPMKQLNNVMFFLDKAERLNYYSNDFLNYRKMVAYVSLSKSFFLKNKFFQSFKYARIAFKYSKPRNLKQKLLYLFSFSFCKSLKI